MQATTDVEVVRPTGVTATLRAAESNVTHAFYLTSDPVIDVKAAFSGTSIAGTTLYSSFASALTTLRIHLTANFY